MQIAEVLVAAMVFCAASGSSMQLWSQAAASAQSEERRAQQLERIELDRLQLQAHWRRELPTAEACWNHPADGLQAVASAVPVPPQVQRELLPGPDPDGVRVRWRAGADPSLQRERLFTLAGLGVCRAEAALDAQPIEEVMP